MIVVVLEAMEEVTIYIKSSDNVCMLQLLYINTLDFLSFPLHFTSHTVLFLGLRSWTGMLCRTYRVGRRYCQWLELLVFSQKMEDCPESNMCWWQCNSVRPIVHRRSEIYDNPNISMAY